MAISICNTVTNGKGQELSAHGTVRFPVACYFDNITESPVPWHWHDDLEALVVAEGSVLVSVGSEKQTLVAGDGVLIPGGALHSVEAAEEGPCALRSICWHPSLTGGREDSVFWQTYTMPFLNDAAIGMLPFSALPDVDAPMRHTLAAWEACANEADGFEADVRYHLTMLLFLCRAHPVANAPALQRRTLREEQRLKQMLQFLQAHLAEPITLAEIAAAASVSVSECLRCFRETLGTTPISYVRRCRLSHAAELIRAGYGIGESAAASGFSDMSYFSKEFKKQFGCTPSMYRA